MEDEYSWEGIGLGDSATVWLGFWSAEVGRSRHRCGTLVRRSLKLEIPTACHCACLITPYAFLVLDTIIMVYYMDIYECSILPSSSSSGVISLQRKWSKHWCYLSSMRTRKNNDWNSQESWVSRASKGYLIEMYICLFGAIRQMFRFYSYIQKCTTCNYFLLKYTYCYDLTE
jgi:hypothetical protein